MLKTILVLSFTLTFSSLISQQEYTWDEYNLAFTLADDFEEDVNNAEEFSAYGEGMGLSIFPFNDDSINEDDITTYTMSIAASLELSELHDISVIELNGFKGGYAEGELDGVRVFLMGLIDPDSESNFFVLIGFDNYDESALDEAVNICQSLRKV